MKRINRIKIICKQCNRPFYDIESNHRKFCSYKCKVNSQKDTAPVICVICGNVFYRIPSKAKKSKCCSLKCQGVLRHSKARKIKKLCIVCSTPFDVWPSGKHTKYCSIKCRNIDAPNIENAGHIKKGTLAWNAGLNHETSDLVKKWTGKNNGNWHNGLSKTLYPGSFNDILKTKIRARDGNKCMFCGAPQAEFDRLLPVHHIDYDKNNCALENLITLCFKHHGATNVNRKEWQSYLDSLLRQTYNYVYKIIEKVIQLTK